ncbi:MAG TPA: response regulator transcription factor, partial [Anaerolineales bacterium]
MSDPIRVLIADDHTIFRDGMTALLKATSDIEVVGEAGTGQEAVEKARTLEPDVILMDVVMPDLNGVVATQRILSRNPAIGVIMLTMLEDDETVFAAM